MATEVRKGSTWIRRIDRKKVRVLAIGDNWVMYRQEGSEVPGVSYITYFVSEYYRTGGGGDG